MSSLHVPPAKKPSSLFFEGSIPTNVVRTNECMVIFMYTCLTNKLHNYEVMVYCFYIVQVSVKTTVLGLQFHWSIILGVLGPWPQILALLIRPTYHTSNLLKLSSNFSLLQPQINASQWYNYFTRHSSLFCLEFSWSKFVYYRMLGLEARLQACIV